MSIVMWSPPSWGNADDTDHIVTAMAYREPDCLFCGDQILKGQMVWVWHGANGQNIVAHAKCLADHASGFLGDIATVVRK